MTRVVHPLVVNRSSSDRTGVLIVRLWIEANHERGMRARITQTLDTMLAEQAVAVVASSEDICAVVKRWVEEFADRSILDPASDGKVGHDDGTSEPDRVRD